MPAIIDHDQRREELAEIAAGLVATGGTEAATVRAVARSAGFSTKVVSHYFENKRALLLATYRFAAQRSERITEASQEGSEVDVATFATALLPIEPAQRQNWLIWYAFWGHAITDPEFAAEQKSQVDGARLRIEALMARDPQFEAVTPAVRAQAARETLTEVIGVALQAVFDPAYWTARRQRSAVRARLSALAQAPARRQVRRHVRDRSGCRR